MNLKSILLLAGVLFAGGLSGQAKFDITGTVKGDGENLISATVVLLSDKDSTMVSFGLTDAEGNFNIKNVASGDYLLQLTYLGFGQYSRQVQLQNADINLGEIALSAADTKLDEIEIKAEHTPMMLNRDTLEYNAAAFQVQPNEVVEDLLRKLPGVEVESDGSIKAQGEDVQEVLVDGKKFFGNDVKTATRNLPADAVNKVQVFDKKSDAAEFSGVDDGERQKTINLELKEDRKSGAFGNVSGGMGRYDDKYDRYRGSLSLNRFSSKTQLSLIGNFNNVNEQGFSTNDYVNFMSGMGWGGGRSAIPMFNGLSNGFVTTNAGGINLNYDLSPKTEISISYFLNDIENTINSKTVRENYADIENVFFTEEMTEQINSNQNHRINFDIEQEIDSTQDLRIRGSYSINTGNASSSSLTQISDAQKSLANSTDAGFVSDGKSKNLSMNATYRKNFGSIEKRTLTLTGQFNDALNESLGDLLSENLIYDEFGMAVISDLIVQDQINDNDQNDYRLELSFVEPLGNEKFLEIKYRRQNFNNDVLSEFYDIVSGDRILNTDISNAFIRDYYYDRYSTALYFNSDKSQLTLEAAVQSSHLTGDIIYQDEIIKTDVFRFLPRVSWRYDFQRGRNIRINYNTSINEPSLQQLQPNPNNSNPFNIYIGNPELVPEYNHRLRLSYFNYDQFTFRSFYAFANVNYTRNNITNVTSFDENFIQTTMPVNVDYNLNLSTTQEYATPVNLFKTRISLRNRFGYTKSLIFINGRESSLERFNGNVRLSLENRNKKIFDWSLGGSYSYNINQYSDARTTNLGFSSQNAFADFRYNLKQSMSFELGANVNFYSEEQFGEAQTIPIVRASISKFLLKDQRGELKLSVFDLMNQNLGISRTENQNYIENSEIVSLARYFMLSFTYSFKPGGGGASTTTKVMRH